MGPRPPAPPGKRRGEGTAIGRRPPRTAAYRGEAGAQAPRARVCSNVSLALAHAPMQQNLSHLNPTQSLLLGGEVGAQLILEPPSGAGPR